MILMPLQAERRNELKLSRYEKETVINFNAADKLATVYTRDRSVMDTFDSLVKDDPAHYKLLCSTDIDRTYEMPKSYIRYRRPRQLSDSHRTAAKERISIINSKKCHTDGTERKDI